MLYYGVGMNNLPRTREFLGVGWKFPIQVTPDGRIAQSRYERSVEESVYLILGTARGERVMLPNFGCGIHDLVFQPNNAATVALVTNEVLTSLVQWEKRIDVLDVRVDTAPEQPNLLLIRVEYRIRANQALGNLVYPFYITERS
jgi:phage baseplate assembly protein W